MRLQEVRAETLKLCENLEIDDYLVQSAEFVSPPKWHLAHTTWFFETFLLTPFLSGYKSFNHDFPYLFNSYYKTMGPHLPRPSRGSTSRPTLKEIFQYRQIIDEALERLVGGEIYPDIKNAAELAIAHEEQHQELLLMDIKHILYQSPSRPAFRRLMDDGKIAIPMSFQHYHGGLVQIGHRGPDFSFDNESPRHQVFLEPYGLANRPVTNREFLQFIDDHGYQKPELWLSEGWEAINTHQWKAPLYWEKVGDEWKVFTLEGMRDLPLDEPVIHISGFEADAFARWYGTRLPTEAEWETALALQPGGLEGQNQIWEWTGSPYAPYPGYRPPGGSLGEYNGKFMCNQWVLRGASFATPPGHTRPTYRNFYTPEMRWHFAGMRLAKDIP